ncbi:protein containing C-terminal region/beta chain of methionyl-tRNA synthetase [Candidatus Methanoperedens nitroreducens]|uniref:Methionine--tRNA ligase n=1 Tax=Candidatus Methanoperedens nitratireducens TaxID=1392998 RepID=A0A062UVC6_9EURY|nr:methionine--tRNA ligase [Candidatus Methanoperedens nitroreducens]KCZ70961.1 protein containing C-terminal region/beta chain of methionyl-tRNA synthetase [Candidatus Methanoperedens nitroreducens]MDJ1421671.1 methionine--tRNA ligase [Candidatus Methanoperedens sp.]
MSNFPSKEPVLVTCGLPYANGRCHIGHLRTYIPADIFVRALRKQCQEAVFICGSDAHGTPIVVNAEELGITPGELISTYHKHFDNIFKMMEVEFNFFGNTDSPTNHARTTSIVESLIDAGYVYPQVIKLAYCPYDKRFLPDRYVEGICPYCGALARGDECDLGCGRHLEPGEIRNARCKICGNPAEYREQEHFFFRLSAFSGFLSKYLETLRGTPNAINYAKEWVRELKDWCITRNLEWGVRFPDHEDLVVYVWVDAPIGYISFTEEWANTTGNDWERYWKGDSRIIHFIGEDITYHHCIFWPAMLKGAGYTLPWAVVASGMLKIEDKKFSKSRGYVVWVDEDYLNHGFHPDLLRYYIASYTSHTKELNFSWKIFQDKVNNELVAAFGNFLHRTLHFAYKNFGGIPEGEVDKEIFDKIRSTTDSVVSALDEYEFKKAADDIMELAQYGNAYFQSHEPWQLIKKDKEACGHVLKNSLQIAKALVLLFEPVLPGKMEKAWKQLSLPGDIHALRFDEALVEIPSQKLEAPEILFSKIEDKKIKEMESILDRRIKVAISKEKKQEIEAEKPAITFEEFQKLDIRIGTVLAAENIPGSDKLLKLEVDIGEKRQVVAGIAKSHKPDQLVGCQVVVLANMKPARLFGVESRGMILAADGDGTVLLLPEKKIKEGTKVR